jgi:hypothetical protein
MKMNEPTNSDLLTYDEELGNQFEIMEDVDNSNENLLDSTLNETPKRNKKKRRFSSIFIFIAMCWGIIGFILAVIMEPTSYNIGLLIAISGSGIYGGIFYFTRKFWVKKLNKHPKRNAIILGITNAIIVEGIFWIVELILGAQDLAADPNFFLDLLITLPWYIGMLIFFVFVQYRHRFSLPIVLLLGAVYEMGGDGIAGPIMGLFFGNYLILTFEYWVYIVIFSFWQFILVYSSIVMPPAIIVNTSMDNKPEKTLPAPLEALAPLSIVPAFILYLLGISLLLGAFA